MKDHFLNDSTPTDEECLQAGHDVSLQKLEAITIIRQIERTFPKFPEGFSLAINRNFHEFGTYFDIKVYYFDNTASEDFASLVENQWPQKWDQTSIDELTAKGYFVTLKESKLKTKKLTNQFY